MLALDEAAAPRRVGCRSATLSGVLRRDDTTSFECVLQDLLSPGGPVLLDVSRVRVAYPPAVRAVSRALLRVGGWPASTPVLVGPDARFRSALRDTGADRDVVVADDVTHGVPRLGARPERVRRRLVLPGRRAVPRAVEIFLSGVAGDWNMPHIVGIAHPIAIALAVNAARHPPTANILTVSLSSEGLRLAVRDFDRHLGRLSRSMSAPNDRGATYGDLTEWGVTPRSDGKIVWALFRVDAAKESGRRTASSDWSAGPSRTAAGARSQR